MNYALSGYPLSNSFRKRFETSIGSVPKYLTVTELRQLSPKDLLKKLRTLDAERLYIPLEDINSSVILPILQGIAALSNARSIEVIYPDITSKKISRLRVFFSILRFIKASVSALIAALKSKRELAWLMNQPLIDIRKADTNEVIYLNANLWFGVKAGGSVGHIAGVINALIEKGYSLDYASAGGQPMISSSIHSFTLVPAKTFGIPFEMNYYRFHHDVLKQLQGLASKEGYAFIYQRMSLGNYSGVILSRKMKIPLILEYNGSEAWIAKNWGRPLRYHDLAVSAENVCLKHAHVIVTISGILKDELIERGVDPERIVFYPNCADPKIFDPDHFNKENCTTLRRNYGISPDSIVVTFIGTFGQWHGVEIMAQAIREMIDKDAEWLKEKKVHFLIVGDGLKMPIVREILSPDYCRPFYTLSGLVPQAEAPLYLAASDILLSPHIKNTDGSRFFGSPTKLFEYTMMGKGIVASDLDQIGEVLKNSLYVADLPSEGPKQDDTYLSVLVPPGDISGIVQGIRFLVENPPWRSQLGKNARKEALSKYTWQHHVNAIIEKLDTLFDNNHNITYDHVNG
jgi:glycosyltransferase involved in cell wall biosynthesis